MYLCSTVFTSHQVPPLIIKSQKLRHRWGIPQVMMLSCVGCNTKHPRAIQTSEMWRTKVSWCACSKLFLTIGGAVAQRERRAAAGFVFSSLHSSSTSIKICQIKENERETERERESSLQFKKICLGGGNHTPILFKWLYLLLSCIPSIELVWLKPQ